MTIKDLQTKLAALVEQRTISEDNEVLIRVTTGGTMGLLTGIDIPGIPVSCERIISKHTLVIGTVGE